jgi:hypothetical protein
MDWYNLHHQICTWWAAVIAFSFQYEDFLTSLTTETSQKISVWVNKSFGLLANSDGLTDWEIQYFPR